MKSAAVSSTPTRYERIYVWQAPVRIFHWVNVASLSVLFTTGLYIAHPVLTGLGEPFEVFVMARFRQVHFAAAFVFTVAFLWRIYWFWMGNRYARSGFPYVWRKRWWGDLLRQAWDYLKLDFGHPHTGHNALAGLSYTIFAIGLGWAQIFTGLEYLGVTGAFPSPPDLLDWLATQLVSSGWDTLAMQRVMVTSATYRQSSDATPAALARDPKNQQLARGPRFRLSAEAVRDNALAISGLLVEQVGGPSVKPYQPDGLWEDVTVERRYKYQADAGAGLYRRSMYTFWKRTCPPPTMSTFDAPNRETCTIRRARTNTPLQALVLLNDPTYVEAARKFAERVLAERTARGTGCSRCRSRGWREICCCARALGWSTARSPTCPTPCRARRTRASWIGSSNCSRRPARDTISRAPAG